MSDEAEVKLHFFKRLKQERQVDDNKDLEKTEGSEALVRGKVIKSPELMSRIFNMLDIQSLMQVRLVWKRWLNLAQFHMERRGVVYFNSENFSTRFQEFVEFKNSLLGLPQPFHSVSLELFKGYLETQGSQFVKQLSSLSPPLGISRLVAKQTRLALTLPLIRQCSSSLECLELRADSRNAGYSHLMDPNQQFPKLKRLKLFDSNGWRGDNGWIHFPSVIAWIIRGSPGLEAFELPWSMNAELTNRLVREIYINNPQNIKQLKCRLTRSVPADLEPYLSAPFRQLEHLQVRIRTKVSSDRPKVAALIVSQCASTLRKLELPGLTLQDVMLEGAFPSCPNVTELTLYSIIYSSNFIPQRFPSLQVLNVFKVQLKMEEGSSWSDLAPLLNIKTLKISELTGLRNQHFGPNRDIPEAVQFFEKLPNLQNLSIRPSLLMDICRLKTTGDRRFSYLLAGLKHLLLDCSGPSYSAVSIWDSGSWLAALSGVEILTMTKFNPAIAFKVANHLPDLRIIQLPWRENKVACSDAVMMFLLGVAERVEKVIVTDCEDVCSCSSSRVRDRQSDELLEEFLELAPNAECGCSTRKVPFP